MKLRIAMFALCLAAVPAMADTLYSNGAINGTTDAWTINFGFAVSDSFTTATNSTLNSIAFGAWLFPGDTILSTEVLVGLTEYGAELSDQIVNLSQQSCSGNQYGYNVCTVTGNLGTPVNLLGGVPYWLTLQNAVVNNGDPVYWDENGGASSASENSVGTIPSEAFTLIGGGTTTCGGPPCGTTGTTAEPSSVMLFGSGILGLASILRRRLF